MTKYKVLELPDGSYAVQQGLYQPDIVNGLLIDEALAVADALNAEAARADAAEVRVAELKVQLRAANERANAVVERIHALLDIAA